MNKVLEYIIGAKDATAGAIKSALNRIKSFASGVMGQLANIKAGFEMIGSAASKAVEFMRKAFRFETMTVQFKTLIGNMDEAREHMKMLQELGDTPPFSLEEFAAASRALMVMTDGALGFRSSLEMIGDAAAATGQPIQNLAHEVGRAYAIIRDGQPLTRATMSLRNMGVLTPEIAQKLQDLQDAGADNVRIWEELETALNRYKGAMEATEQTGEGLMGAIQAQWDDTLREFGEACLETAKDGLGGLLAWMRELRENGSIAVWADEVCESLKKVGDSVRYAASLFTGLWKVVKGTVGVAMAFGAGADDAFAEGESFFSQIKAGVRTAGQMWHDTWNEPDENQLETLHKQTVRERSVQRQADDAAKKEQKRIVESAKIKESLAEGQRKIDARNAEAAAKKEWEEYEKGMKKAAEEEERAMIEAERAIAAERQRLWDIEVRERQQDLQKQLADAQAAEADAQAALRSAMQNESQAWGWCRDKDAWKAQLAEERANAEAEVQFEKDFRSLKRRRTAWRTAENLTDEEEIVRRVGLAREQREAAEDYARQTAEDTARAANALEEIEQAINEGSAE